MWNLIKYLQKKLIISIPLFMVMGLIYGSYFEVSFLKKLVMPFTILMVYPMMVNLNINELAKKGNLKLQFITQLINFVFMPLIGFAIGNLFFKDNTYIVLGLLLTSLLPTSGMTISWTGFANGNISEAIKMTIIGLILGSILSPLYLKYFMGTSIQIPLANIFKQILMVVFLPMIAGIITRKLIILKCGQERYNKEYKQKFPPLSTLGVLAMVFTAMALKSKTIMSDPMVLVNLLLPLILLYIINFTVSTVIAKLLFDKKDAIALIYGTVMRNLSIALAIAMAVFKENGTEIALIIAIAYIVQVQAGAWYVKFTDKILGV